MFKWTSVISLIVVISFWHIRGSHLSLEGHLLHQELFFIPIIFASFWFRLPAGIIVACIVSMIYLSSMVTHLAMPGIRIAVASQIVLYILIAALIGWLTSRLHGQQLQIIKDEQRSSLAKLASALSSEIHDVVRSLEIKYEEAKGQHGKSQDIDFKQEINRLDRLTKAFTQLNPPDSQDPISTDLNKIAKSIQKKFRQTAAKSQVDIKVELDSAGCPSMVVSEAIIQLFEALIINAIEFSPKHSAIFIKTTRKGAFCIIEVKDSGPGVKQEDITKLFKPFFTTKPDGYGLSLAAGKKILRDCEGDLLYEQGEDGGAVFKIIVPRENRDKNIAGFISSRVQQLDT